MKKEDEYKNYIARNEYIERHSYELEFDFYSSVKNGDVKKLEKELKKAPFSTKFNWGTLSDNEHRNNLYHFIITAALLARICMDGGMNINDAYSLSDYYIQKADKTKVEDELSRIHYDMVIDYATRMKQTKKTVYSKPIAKCINYIYDNLNRNISTDEIASKINLSRSYLSTLFKKETGYTLNEFIIIKKIQTATNMLKYSDYTISDISTNLDFSSQSYFTKLFKKYTGETPKKYANKIHNILPVK